MAVFKSVGSFSVEAYGDVPPANHYDSFGFGQGVFFAVIAALGIIVFPGQLG